MALNRIDKSMIDPEFTKEINDKFDEVDAQLAQTREKVRSNLTIKSERKIPVITFLDDDSRIEVWERLKPISEEKGVPFCEAVITGRFNDTKHMNEQQIKYLQDELNWEMLGQSYTHPTANRGLVEYDDDYERLEFEIGEGCKDILTDLGINVSGFVYPQSGHTFNIREVTKKHYDYAFGGNGFNDQDILDSMVIRRIAFGAYTDANPTVNGNSEKNTLAYYKACVDYAIEKNIWLIFMLHVAVQDENHDQILRDLIDYIKSTEARIMTARDAYKIHGNRVFAGDVEAGNYFILNKDNKALMSAEDEIKTKWIPFNSKNPHDPIETYDENSITFMRCTYSFASENGLPENKAGFLVTYRLYSEGYQYNKQEYWVSMDNKEYRRFVNADNSWSEFKNMNQEYNEITLSMPEQVIPANSYVDVDFDVPGVQAHITRVFGNPAWGILPNMLYNITIQQHDKVRVRLFNLGGQDITLTARDWFISYKY